MAEQPPLPDTVTPAQFFEELLPMGFATQQAAAAAPPPDVTLQYHIEGDGGGAWTVRIESGKMAVTRGQIEAPLTVSLHVEAWRDAVLGRNGAVLSLVVPEGRAGRPENAQRMNALKGTMALELSRDGADPFKLEMRFNNAPQPRTTMKMKIADYIAMQAGKLNGQEAFMTGKLRVEGDLAFLMQIATLTQ